LHSRAIGRREEEKIKIKERATSRRLPHLYDMRVVACPRPHPEAA
jgi:hypothetical protein